MPVQRKVFRIEQMNPARLRDAAPAEPSALAQDILTELRSLRALIELHMAGAPAGDAPALEQVGLRKLRNETDAIHRAIAQTKIELASLHANAFAAPEKGRVVRELDAVVAGSERATQQILSAAEEIDQAANMLAAAVRGEQEQGLAQDIQDHVVRIFEACNFQDLIGQRVSKVLTTLTFIEQRIAHMMEIWGGVEAMNDQMRAAMAARDVAAPAMHGPRLDSDHGHVTQAEVDAIFADRAIA
jgi:chemotaxis protein CheZ